MPQKFRKKPIVVEAYRWFKNGDHPQDGTEVFPDGPFQGQRFEGKIVRYYRCPEIDGYIMCRLCANHMKDHGWIDTLEGGHALDTGSSKA